MKMNGGERDGLHRIRGVLRQRNGRSQKKQTHESSLSENIFGR
jgi:hypothetical protein